MVTDLNGSPVKLAVGDVYEDCAYHPSLCTQLHSDDSIEGISLLDGSGPRICDLYNCGAVLIPIEYVLLARQDFDTYVERRKLEDSAVTTTATWQEQIEIQTDGLDPRLE